MASSSPEAMWFYSVAQGDQDAVRSMVNDFRGYVNGNGDTALIQACRANNLKVVQLLVPYEAGLTSTTGYTALMVAALSNNPGLCEILAPLEKDIILDDGRDSYMLAAQVGAAAALLMMSKNFKLRQDKARLNALDYAVNSGHLDCVNIILSTQRISSIELKYAINVASENHFIDIERTLIAFKSNLRRISTVSQSQGPLSQVQAQCPRLSQSHLSMSTQQFQTRPSACAVDHSPSPRHSLYQVPLTTSQVATLNTDSMSSSIIEADERSSNVTKTLKQRIVELTKIIQLKDSEIMTLQMENMKLQQSHYATHQPPQRLLSMIQSAALGLGPNGDVAASSATQVQMVELTERLRHLEDAYAILKEENKALTAQLQQNYADDTLAYEDLEYVKPNSPRHARSRSQSVASTPKDKVRSRTPSLCAPRRNGADSSENVFVRKHGKYLGDLPSDDVSMSVPAEQFEKIIAEKNNTINMLQELIHEYQSRGAADMHGSVGYQEIKAESTAKARSSSRLSTSGLVGRNKSNRKDGAPRASTNFDAYRRNTMLQLAERDKEIHILREQLAAVEADSKVDGACTPKTLEANREELLKKVIAEQSAKITELQELFEATELHCAYVPVTETTDSLNDKIKAQDRTIEELMSENEVLKKELSERPQHTDSKLCKMLASSRVSVRGLTGSLCASTVDDNVEAISSTNDLIVLISEKDAEIERLRGIIDTMPELDLDRLEQGNTNTGAETSPKQIQLLLNELDAKNQEIEELKISLSNIMTSSKRSVSLSKPKRKDRSRDTTPLLGKGQARELADENDRLVNEMKLLAERIQGLEAENERLEKDALKTNIQNDLTAQENIAKMKKTIQQLQAANERLVAENEHLKDRIQRTFTKSSEQERIANILDSLKDTVAQPASTINRLETPGTGSALTDATSTQQLEDGQNSTARLNMALGIVPSESANSLGKQSNKPDLLQEKCDIIEALQAELQEKNEEIDRLKCIINAYNPESEANIDTPQESSIVSSTIDKSAKRTKSRGLRGEPADKRPSRATTPSSMSLSSSNLMKSKSAFLKCKTGLPQGIVTSLNDMPTAEQAEIIALKQEIQAKDAEIQRLLEEAKKPHTITDLTDPEVSLEQSLVSEKEKVKLLTIAANEQELEISQLKAEIQRLTTENNTLLSEIQAHGEDMDVLRETQEKLKAIESTVESKDMSIVETTSKLESILAENKQLRRDKKDVEARLRSVEEQLSQQDHTNYDSLLAEKDAEAGKLRLLLEGLDARYRDALERLRTHTEQETIRKDAGCMDKEMMTEPAVHSDTVLSNAKDGADRDYGYSDDTVEKLSVFWDAIDALFTEHTDTEKNLRQQVQTLQVKFDAATGDDLVARLEDPVYVDTYEAVEERLQELLKQAKTSLRGAQQELAAKTFECDRLRQEATKLGNQLQPDNARATVAVARLTTPEPSEEESPFLLMKPIPRAPSRTKEPEQALENMSQLLAAKDAEIHRLQQLLEGQDSLAADRVIIKRESTIAQEEERDMDSLLIENVALANEVDLLNLSISIQNNVISTIADHYIKRLPSSDQPNTIALLEGKILSLSEQLAQADSQVAQLRTEAHLSRNSSMDAASRRRTSTFLPRSHPLSDYRAASALRTSIDQDKRGSLSCFEESAISATSIPDANIIGLVKPSVAPVVTAIIRDGDHSMHEPLKERSELMNAIAAGDMPAIGANLQQAGYTLEDGTTALMLAAEHNVPAAVKYLAEFEAGKQRTDGKRAIDIALEREHLKVAVQLLNFEGMDVSMYSAENNRKTELMTAAESGDLYKVFNLLGFQKRLQDMDGKTALMYACEKGHFTCAKLLLMEKDITDTHGNGPLSYLPRDLSLYADIRLLLADASLGYKK